MKRWEKLGQASHQPQWPGRVALGCIESWFAAHTGASIISPCNHRLDETNLPEFRNASYQIPSIFRSGLRFDNRSGLRFDNRSIAEQTSLSSIIQNLDMFFLENTCVHHPMHQRGRVQDNYLLSILLQWHHTASIPDQFPGQDTSRKSC